MRKLTTALLIGAYAFVSLMAAALLWRSGGGVGAAVSLFVGAFSFALAVHGMMSAALSIESVRAEMQALQTAQKTLAASLAQAESDIEQLSSEEEAQVRRSDELSSEVRVLEDLVGRIGETIVARAAAWQAQSVAAAGAGESRRHEDDRRDALLQTVRGALSENRVDLYLQPVVSLPQRRTIFYESFSRLRDETGRVIMPSEYLSVAEPEGLVSAIDNLLLFRCVQIVRKLSRQDRKVGIFCNVSLESLRDETFFPQFLEFLAEHRDLAGALIFELGQAQFDQRGATESRNMAKLADLGFRFSIDKVTDLDLNFADLGRADVKFVKVGADVLIDRLLNSERPVAKGPLRDLHPSDFAALTRRYGVEPIAEKVETERQAIDVLELDVAYGQGHLFGEPRAIREAIMAETAPPVGFIQPVLRRRAPAGAARAVG